MDIIVEVFRNDKYEGKDWPSDNAFEFIEWFNEKISSIPEEFRESATIDILPGYGDCPVTSIEIYYKRPETEDEIKEREFKAQKIAEIEKFMELNKLEQLKKKYEQ
jgi:hypothetical protein